MIKVGTHFSGIGAPEKSLETLGIDFECLFAAEKDKYAQQTYLANHKTKVMFDDVTKIDNNNCPYVDLFFSGFPCQTFSIAGARKGFDDVRGTMFFYSADYIRKQRPRVFIMENVKGLLSHDRPKGSKAVHGNTFNTMINLLAKTINGQTLLMPYEDNLGYNVFYKVLNSKHYDVPQNRERIFIVGFRDDEDADFNFPSSKTVSKKLSDILEPVVDEKYYLSDKMLSFFSKHNENNKKKGNGFNFKVKDINGVANCVNARIFKMGADDNYIQEPVCAAMRGREDVACLKLSRTEYGKEIRKDYEAGNIKEKRKNIQQLEVRTDGITNTITSVQKDNLILEEVVQLIGNKESGDTQPYQQNRVYSIIGQSPSVMAQMSFGSHAVLINTKIRRLTVTECARLQAFPDDFIIPVSDTQGYRQMGNTITVNVLCAIIKKIKFLYK